MASIARGALLVAALPMLSRMFALIRTLVFPQTIGASCLGTAYFTANQVPSLIYELALGGWIRGPAAVQGVGRAGLAAGAAGCAVIVFGVIAYLLDAGDLRTVLTRLRQAGRRYS